MVYCNNIVGLIELMGLDYDAMEWRLLIDSSCRSLKAVLLYQWNIFSSIPIGHSEQIKETHNSMDYLLSAVYYHEHKWLICGELKRVGLILGLQGGYTKFPCFLCLWDSQADDQHYVKQELKPGLHNVQSHPLTEPNKILLPPLHIEFGEMKNFVKAMDMAVSGFAFLQKKSP